MSPWFQRTLTAIKELEDSKMAFAFDSVVFDNADTF